MKLPDIFQSIFKRHSKTREVYVSLYLDTMQVAGSFFTIEKDGVVTTLASRSEVLKNDSWEERGVVVDEILGLLEEKTGHTDVSKAILGLPPVYLTATGEIQKDVRIHIKEFMRELELKAIGFVPLQQAIIFKMRFDEGVPPSVILLGINDQGIEIGVYKVGELSGVRQIEKHDDIVENVEQGLRSFSDIEVLPARILLYGSNQEELEEGKAKLLKHQWTSKVNFLHFPKIETITEASIVESISFAGASELGASMTDVEPEAENEDELPPELTDEDTKEAIADVTPIVVEPPKDEHIAEEIADAEEVISEDFSVVDVTEADDNVVMVDAESLGFKKDVDVLEELATAEPTEDEEDEEEVEEERGGMKLPSMNFLHEKKPIVAIAISITIILTLIGSLFWFLPHATVKILEIPKSFETSQAITIDPTASVVDAQGSVIPGKKRDKAETGEKTVPVNGKKNVGEPAKGSVTIYNKATSSRTFKKGTVLTSKSFQFSLDQDVQVDAATVSGILGGETKKFGTQTASVTAVVIGSQSNMTSGSDFSFKDISTETATATNDKAFVGGTSREVTVVSRSDYDTFVKVVSAELTEKAKQGFAQVVSGSEKIIDATIKTTVTEKVFNQEIDEEAKELQGKLTVTMSGIAYAEADVRALLSSISSNQVPSGYVVNDSKTTVTLSDIQVKKDGKITGKATMQAYATPVLDLVKIQAAITGKNIPFVQNYLKALPGVGGVEIGFGYSPTSSILPLNKKNISIIIQFME